MKRSIRTLLCGGLFLGGLGLGLFAKSRPPARAEQAMVVSPTPGATRAGLEVLRQGGDAVDAAIATMAGLSVSTPGSSGIGGGFFALVYRADEKKVYVLDARETAPAKAHRDMYVRNGKPENLLSRWGSLAIAIPGEVRGYEALHQRWGKLAWKDLFEPAARIGEEGARVEDFLSFLIDEVGEPASKYPEMKRLFGKPGGWLETGDWYRNPDQAKTLRRLAKEGPEWFYRGELAHEIVAEVKRLGGILSLQDLADYRVRWREPVRGKFMGAEVVSMPPPSSGGAILIEILQILDRWPLEKSGAQSSGTLHLVAEAMRLAFRDRALTMGDPGFVTVPTERLTSLHYAKEWARNLRPYRRIELPPASIQATGDGGTNHLCVRDPRGNLVAATTTINYAFGSLVAVPGRGFVLNNEMDDFSIAPGVPNAFGLVGSEANSVAAGKIPLSSMTPTIVLQDGEPRIVVGAAGGPKIITGTLQAILQVLAFGKNAQEALDAPRIHHQWVPDQLMLEDSVPADAIRALEVRGHPVKPVRSLRNRVQLMTIHPDHIEGASDPREQGLAEGY